MRLLSEALIKRFAEVGGQEESKDPIVITKFFNPTGAGIWYATEWHPDIERFFGYVSIFGNHNDEWGYFSLDELETYRSPWGIEIERDLFWKEKPASQVVPGFKGFGK